MDAFYASVEQRDDPELRGKPVIVGGDRQSRRRRRRELRGSRVRRALGDADARGAAALPARDLRPAAHRSLQLGVAGRSSPCFTSSRRSCEGLSLDEAFLDVTASIAAFGSGRAHRRRDQAPDPRRTELTCVGRRGAEQARRQDRVRACASPTGSCRRAGRSVAHCSIRCRCASCSGSGRRPRRGSRRSASARSGELQSSPSDALRPVFGRYTERVQQRAAGIDDRPVVPDLDEKQISAEETFDTDIADHAAPAARTRAPRRQGLRAAARSELASALRRTVKIRRGDFTTYTRQRHIEPPTQETRVITRRRASSCSTAWLATQPRAALRLLGVGVSELAAADAARSVHGAGIDAQPAARSRRRSHPRALRQRGVAARPARCRKCASPAPRKRKPD